MTDYFALHFYAWTFTPPCKRELKAFPSIILYASVEIGTLFDIVNISPLSFISKLFHYLFPFFLESFVTSGKIILQRLLTDCWYFEQPQHHVYETTNFVIFFLRFLRLMFATGWGLYLAQGFEKYFSVIISTILSATFFIDFHKLSFDRCRQPFGKWKNSPSNCRYTLDKSEKTNQQRRKNMKKLIWMSITNVEYSTSCFVCHCNENEMRKSYRWVNVSGTHPKSGKL